MPTYPALSPKTLHGTTVGIGSLDRERVDRKEVTCATARWRASPRTESGCRGIRECGQQMLGCCSLGSPPSAVEAGRRLTRGLSLDPAFDATELAVERLAGQPSAVYDHAGDPRRVRDILERVRVEQDEVSSFPDVDGSLATPPTAVSSRRSVSDRPSPRAPSPTGIASRGARGSPRPIARSRTRPSETRASASKPTANLWSSRPSRRHVPARVSRSRNR
jgi:hypothetical protein